MYGQYRVIERVKFSDGTTGVVFWYGHSRYARSDYAPKRVGFKTADGEKFFCSETCVEVVGGKPKLDEAGIADEAKRYRGSWTFPFAVRPGMIRV